MDKQVQRTQAGWSGPGSDEGSVLCSAHFEMSCFEPFCLLSQSMGLQKKLLLKPDAVPTIFPRSSRELSSQAAAGIPLSYSQQPCSSKRKNEESEIQGT